MRARLHALDWTTVLPAAPVRRARQAIVPDRIAAGALSPAASEWLLPPAWPFEEWHARVVATARETVDLRRGMAGGVARRSGLLVVGVAIIAAVAAVLAPTGAGPRRHGKSVSTRSTTIPATVHSAATRPQRVGTTSLPSRVARLAASAPAIAPVLPLAPVAGKRTPWTDVSTMDLMMPIAEPDLDITSGTSLWSQIGKASGVDPLLLYSVALVESKALYPDGKVAPTPWLFRVNDHLVRGDRHDVQLAMAAASQFGSAVQDVGIMQVYYPMHRDAVRDPLTLLNPRTNITVAAKILRAGMRQTHDLVLGVGYYHSHTPSLARDYGTAVMTVYQRLRALHRRSAHRHVVARS